MNCAFPSSKPIIATKALATHRPDNEHAKAVRAFCDDHKIDVHLDSVTQQGTIIITNRNPGDIASPGFYDAINVCPERMGDESPGFETTN